MPLTAEDFRDKIKPLPESEFKAGDVISPEKLASYLNEKTFDIHNTSMDAEPFFNLSGRSDRVGNYSLERQRCTTAKNLSKTWVRFLLKDHSYKSKCNENGIIDCRVYAFVVDGENLKCIEIYHEMFGFYDQMSLSEDGKSIQVYV